MLVHEIGKPMGNHNAF